MKRLFLLFPPVLFALPAQAQSQMWNNPASGVFATALAQSQRGDWWAGSDDEGLFRRDDYGKWGKYADSRQLGDNNITSILVDPANRVWVGTASAGVTIYDGVTWKRYNVWNGPLSNRINDLKVDSTGTVWGATDAGLFRWNDKDGWQYPGIFALDATTRELARRPVYSIAIESPASILAATDDGLNRVALVAGEPRIEPIGRASARTQPTRSNGTGFLPGPTHKVALDSLGQIWCASRYGVSISKDAGKTWQFLRGSDWQDNVKGSAVPLTITAAATPVDLLSEDWVSTLTPTADGKMWLGFRQKGAEERDCHSLELLVSTRDDPKSATQPSFGGDWTTAIVPLGNDNAAFARYGGGLGSLFGLNLPTRTAERIWDNPPLPENAKFSSQLIAELARNIDGRTPLGVGQGVFYNLDRETRGDWPLRYGNEGGRLTGMYDEESDFIDPTFELNISTGPHRVSEAADCYVYTHWSQSDNPNVVQMPKQLLRRQSEINDGTWQSAKYPYYFEGPDLWTSLSVPEGLHRIAFYWFNKDSHSGDNRMRDHRIELFPSNLTSSECLRREPMAKARFWSGWNGEYASFAVRGPSNFRIRIARDRSKGTILQGFFIDRLGDFPSKPDWLSSRFNMPAAPQFAEPNPTNAALTLWNSCDQAETRGVPCSIERTIALRAAKETGAPEAVLSAWRLQAGLWDQEGTDRKAIALKQP